MDNTGWKAKLAQDARYGIRMLLKNPGFTVIAVLTLALGIGVNTAVFSVVDGVLLKPLPFSDPNQLVALYSGTSEGEKSTTSYPNFLDWETDNRSFSALAAFRPDSFNLAGLGVPERIPIEMLSASFFPLLDVRPVLGRTFLSSEDRVGARPVALISAGFWQRKFASSPDVVGKGLLLSGTLYTIVGVIPSNFQYRARNFHHSDIYIPIGQWSDPTFRNRKTSNGMDVIGRLKADVTFRQATADLTSLFAPSRRGISRY